MLFLFCRNTVTGITPVTQAKKESSLKIVPNATGGMVSFQLETVTERRACNHCKRYKCKLVKTFTYGKTTGRRASIHWNAEQLPKGNYLVKIVTPNGETLSKKLLIE